MTIMAMANTRTAITEIPFAAGTMPTSVGGGEKKPNNPTKNT
jgi:hypothetical protein